MATWPVTLPAMPLYDGNSETLPQLTIRTSMDTGPQKVRRRFTAGVRPFAFNYSMTTAQVAIFDTFYTTTTSGGADTFSFTHPRTGATLTCRFVGQPKAVQVAADLWRVSVALEALP